MLLKTVLAFFLKGAVLHPANMAQAGVAAALGVLVFLALELGQHLLDDWPQRGQVDGPISHMSRDLMR